VGRFGKRLVRPAAVAACLLHSIVAPAAAAQSDASTAGVSSRENLIRYLDAQAGAALDARGQRIAAITTPAAAAARQAAVRAGLLALIGQPRHGMPLAATVTGMSRGDGYRVENVMYDAQPGRHVTANLFVPTGVGTGPFPALIVAPGHGPAGKSGDYHFAANFARNGFVVLAYDIVGEGERLEYFDAASGRSRGERPTGDHSIAAFPAILNGESLARYFVEDAMQGVDYLLTRPEVDGARIGAFGCSGGGTATAYLAALDERVRAAASACYVNDFRHLLASVGPQDGEQSIPGFIAGGFDIADWVELAAPKPYAVVSTTEDMFPYAGAAAAVDEIRHLWAADGAPDNLVWLHGPGPHGAIAPLGDAIVAFFRHALGASAPAVPFSALRPARPEDLLVTKTGQVATAMGTVTLADLARERARAIAPAAPSDTAGLRAAIVKLAGVRPVPVNSAAGLAANVPATTASDMPADRSGIKLMAETRRDGLRWSTWRFASAMGPLEARLVQPGSEQASAQTTQTVQTTPAKLMLLLDRAPLATLGKPGGRLARLAAEGWTVLALQIRGADGREELKSAVVGDENLLSLRAMMAGATLPGIRIADTLRAVDWLARTMPQLPILVNGIGVMGPVALQAAMLEPRIAAVRTEGAPVSWRDAMAGPLARELPANAIPGVLVAYDLPDLIAALAPRAVDIAAPVDPLGLPLREAAFERLVPPLPHIHYLPYADIEAP
jgi:dienelactone hydrolase